MKIRIIQSGYETFTGLLGDVKFDNGVSVGQASEQQVAYVAAMFITETFEDSEADQDASAQATEAERIAAEQADIEAKAAEAQRLAEEAERERAEAEAAEAAAQAAAAEVAAEQAKKAAK